MVTLMLELTFFMLALNEAEGKDSCSNYIRHSFFSSSPDQQIYREHEDKKKRLYANRVLEVEHGTFTPLVFTTIGGMADECKRFHSRLVELISIKKGEEYSTTISWICSKVSFTLLKSALFCLRGSRTTRHVPLNIEHCDFEVEKEQVGSL